MKSRTTAFFVLALLIAAVSGTKLAQSQSGDENLQYGLRALQQHNFAAVSSHSASSLIQNARSSLRLQRTDHVRTEPDISDATKNIVDLCLTTGYSGATSLTILIL
ncbi:MAG: hypothetical protein ACRD2B_10880, partial [Terriglobia bacterium]